MVSGYKLMQQVISINPFIIFLLISSKVVHYNSITFYSLQYTRLSPVDTFVATWVTLVSWFYVDAHVEKIYHNFRVSWSSYTRTIHTRKFLVINLRRWHRCNSHQVPFIVINCYLLSCCREGCVFHKYVQDTEDALLIQQSANHFPRFHSGPHLTCYDWKWLYIVVACNC